MNQKTSLLQNVISFLKKPTHHESNTHSTTQKLQNTLTLLSWCFILVMALGIALGVLINSTGFQGNNLVETLLNEESILLTIILAAIIAPTIEEVVFRLPLKYTPQNLGIALAALTVLVLARVQETIPFLLLTAAIPLLATLYMQLFRKSETNRKIETPYTSHFTLIFYSSAILFGCVHMLNYTDIQSGLAILPLLVIPQTIVGILLGFVRVQYGFKYAVLFHGLYNASLIIPALTATRDPQNHTLLVIVGFYFMTIITYGATTLFRQTLSVKKAGA